MSLTLSQKAAGKLFRDGRMAALAAMPPAAACSPFVREYRHSCPKHNGASIAVRMREHYETSLEYWVCYCSVVGLMDPEVFPHRDCDGGTVATPEGFFAFIWIDGKCTCGWAARSTGRLVLASERGPDA